MKKKNLLPELTRKLQILWDIIFLNKKKLM